MRLNMQSPFISGSIAAVIYAVIYLLTGGGGSGLVLGSLLVGALATAITFIVHAVIVTKRGRTRA